MKAKDAFIMGILVGSMLFLMSFVLTVKYTPEQYKERLAMVEKNLDKQFEVLEAHDKIFDIYRQRVERLETRMENNEQIAKITSDRIVNIATHLWPNIKYEKGGNK